MKFTKEIFCSFYKNTTTDELAYDAVVAALSEQGILTDLTLIGALATCRVEVGRAFRPIREVASGQAYEMRRDLGNTRRGDGVKYKGRGLIQLTGKANYAYYGDKLGLDLLNNPDIALDINVSAKILALYFKDRKVNVACDSGQWTKVRRLVNGGRNGLNEFISVVNQYLSKI